jgi:hypothetical protein
MRGEITESREKNKRKSGEVRALGRVVVESCGEKKKVGGAAH